MPQTLDTDWELSLKEEVDHWITYLEALNKQGAASEAIHNFKTIGFDRFATVFSSLLASQKQELIKRFEEKLEPVIFEWCESWSAGGIDASNRESCKADLRSKLQELKESI